MDAKEAASVPSLQHLCIEAAAAADFWRVQKRHLQFLPEHAANQLLSQLLNQHRLTAPAQLSNFRHCATLLRINARLLGLQLSSEWLAYIADMSHLRVLVLCEAPRLKDKALLSALPRLAGSLQQLDLTGCTGITRASLAAVQQLTQLQQLVLTGTGIRSPFLNQITTLTALTSLHLGGCDVTDDDITCHIASFQLLQQLDLWGSLAGDPAVPSLAQLPCLTCLNMAWCQVHAAVPFFQGLTHLDLSHCQLEGNWEEQEAADNAALAAAAAGGLQLVQLVLQQTSVSLGAIELLEAVIRSSAPRLQLLNLAGLKTNTSNSHSQLAVLLLALGNCSQLTSLNLSSIGVHDDFLPALSPCTRLRTLNLSQNAQVTAAGLEVTLPGMAQLQQLDLSGTHVADDVLPVLRQLRQLVQLQLADTDVGWRTAAATGAVTGAGAGGDDTGDARESSTLANNNGKQTSAGCTNSQQQVAPWKKLQVLDLARTQITDAGCALLVSQLVSAAAAAAAAAAEASVASLDSSSSAAGDDKCGKYYAGGLRVLKIGGKVAPSSSSSKPGRKSLAALGQLETLEQLTLEGFQMSAGDLDLLEGLQQLQELHVWRVDPWLLADTALTGLTELLPSLTCITRNGQVLLQQATAAASGAAAAASEANAAAGISGLQTSPVVAAAAGSSGSMETRRKGASTSASGSSSRPSAGSTRHSSKGTLFQHLSEYDERYRYSTVQLLHLRPLLPATAHSPDTHDHQTKSDDGGSSSSSSSGDDTDIRTATITHIPLQHQHQQQQQQQQVWSDLELIPPELRASSPQGNGRWR